MSFSKIGIIYAPFQVPTLGYGPLSHFLSEDLPHDAVIALLPVRRMPPSPSKPFDFATRKTLLESTTPLVFPVFDQKTVQDQVRVLDEAIATAKATLQSAHFSGAKVTLYVDAEFYTAYRKYTKTKHTVVSTPFVEWEETIRKESFKLPTNDSEEYRLGVLHAMNSQYPVQFPAVDIAILSEDGTEILLGRKPGEKNFRFPGGFKDRKDPSFEVAATREATEEVLDQEKFGIAPLFTLPQYVASFNVNDWRYAGDPWGIVTLLFKTTFTGTPDQIKAADDLEEVKWFPVKAIFADSFPIETEHVPLLNALRRNLIDAVR